MSLISLLDDDFYDYTASDSSLGKAVKWWNCFVLVQWLRRLHWTLLFTDTGHG